MTTTGVNPRLEAALLYAALGWPVVPLHTPDSNGTCDCHQRDADDADKHPIGKHPRTMRGLEDATTDERFIRRWWTIWPHANIAIDLARSNLVDIAPDSLEWFAEFTARGLPPTLSFRSGGGEGHAHHLYARPTDCVLYRDCQTGKYDVMSSGYAVMPPSVHGSGRSYEWIEPTNGRLISTANETVPGWAKRMLNERSQRVTSTPTWEVDPDAPPVVLRNEGLERWYGRMYDSKKNGKPDRSKSLWKLATILLGAGLTPPFVEDLIEVRDQQLGWTKFTGRRDAHTRYRIITARAVAGEGPGRARVKPKPQPVSAKDLSWESAIGLRDVEDENMHWYAHGRAGAGLLTELDGKAKLAGKTSLLAELCYAVLHGEEFLGEPTSYTPILYLTEQSGPSFKRSLSRAGLLDRDDLYILLWNGAVGHKWGEIVKETRRHARQVGAGLVIVDTLAQFSGIRGDDENKSGAALETLEPLQAATTDGLAVVVSRHDRKSGGEVADSGRGSSAYAGAADIVLHLQRLTGDQHGKQNQRMLEAVSRFEETRDKVLIEFERGEAGERSSFHVLGDPVRLQKEAAAIDILASLPTARDDAPTFEELRADLGLRALEVRRVLNELIHAGQVEWFDRPRRYRQVAPRDLDD